MKFARWFRILLLLLIIPVGVFSQSDNSKMKQFINELMNKMTLEEKLGQLNLPTAGDIVTGEPRKSDIAGKIVAGKVGGLFNVKSVAKIKAMQKIAVEESRLGIPIIFGMDVIHGYESVFPIPLGLSASWDLELIEKSARIAAEEASADGINWTFSPMTDISRDPRWGRVSEGSGEDPFLGSAIARAMVKGYQGDDLSRKNTLLATVKHFALYGAPEGGRDYNTVDMSRIRMYNEYFPPYKAGVDAGAGSVMTAFNEVDGIPATGNKWLLTDVLRKQWGFSGFIVTDYTSIDEMVDHGMGDFQAVSAMALKAGADMDMAGEGMLTTLKKSLDEGKASLTDIDRAVKLILQAKYQLGLFDDPYRYLDEERARKTVFSAENRAVARKIAAESMVLMENSANILPLKKSGKIALIGPLADTRENMPGTWSVAAVHANAVSLRDGLSSLDGVEVLYAKGSNLTYDVDLENNSTMFGRSLGRDDRTDAEMLEEALDVANKADVIIAALGEASEMSGESSSRTNIEIPEVQRVLLDALLKTGKPVVLVLFTGRPLVLGEEKEKVQTILNVWFAGSEAGHAITDVLFGDVNPSGKLTMTFPRSVGQIPLYYNHKNTGRPQYNKEGRFEKFRSNYLDEWNEPLYPFGYGLSYTSFEYSDIRLSASQLKGEETLQATVTLTNTGKYDGAEVVQLYIRDKVGSVTRPVKELKGFQKVFLKVGEKQDVTFEIDTELLKFYNYDLEYDWEAGEFEIMIGTHSAALQSKSVQWEK